jgi:hypothetical protein
MQMPISECQGRRPPEGRRSPLATSSRDDPQTEGIFLRGDLWFGSLEGEATGEPGHRAPHAGEGEEALGVLLVGHPHGPRILEILDTRPA